MNKDVLNTDVQNFIKDNKVSISKLALSGSPFENVTTIALIQQIESRRSIEKKLPTWYGSQNIYFPPKLNLEQASSEETAAYKATIVSGRSIADITSGFGVDAYFFSKKFKTVNCYEINKELSDISEHNIKSLQVNNVFCYSGNGLESIRDIAFDVIYVDPSRRHTSKGKVYYLHDCEPNMTEILPFLFERCIMLLVKSSPMLDLTQGLKELSAVIEIHIVAVGNEVKEVLWLMKPNSSLPLIVKTINFAKHKVEVFDFKWNQPATVQYSKPKHYLYSPNAAIMKSGAFDLISENFKLFKLHKNTHLYTSDEEVDFPGRRFLINQVVSYSKKELKKYLPLTKANIATRNFPESVALLRKKWKIKEGGDLYLFFVTIKENERVVLFCSKD